MNSNSDSEKGIRGRSRLTLICWFQFAVSALLFVLTFYIDLRAPELGLIWNRQTGVVSAVVPGGASDLAGVRAGERLLTINGRSSLARRPLHAIGPDEPAELVVRGDEGVRVAVAIPPKRVFARWEAASLGGVHATRAFSMALRFLINSMLLVIAAVLLASRPHLPIARIIASAFCAWSGGNLIGSFAGFGSALSFGASDRLVIELLDATNAGLFFGLLLHFALVFPQPLPAMRRRGWLQLLPYFASLPLVLAGYADAFGMFSAGVDEALGSFRSQLLFDTYAPLLLTMQPLLLSLHFRHVVDQNDLRRLRLVFLALLPPLVTWIFRIQIQYLPVSSEVRAAALAAQWIAIAVAAVILTVVVVRYRVFGLRPLVRGSIQYAFARGTLLFITTLPLVAVGVLLWSRRYQTLASLVTDDFVLLIVLLAPLTVLLRFRQNILDAIDRRFFREEYDARRALMRVASVIERGSDVVLLARVALFEVEKAFHPKHAALWLRSGSGDMYQRVVATGAEMAAPVLRHSQFVLSLLRGHDDGVEFDRKHATSSIRKLSHEDIEWLHRTGAALLVPLTIEQEICGFILLGDRLSEEPYSTADRELLQAIATQLALAEHYGRLEVLARRDPLTDALNRHAFYSLLEKKRVFPFETTGGCVAVVDLDDLKKINDTHGHAMGDQAIRRVATAVRSIVRADDLVFRWGGDEFLVVAYGLSAAEVGSRLDDVNVLIGRTAGEEREQLSLHVSVGVAEFDDIAALPDAIDRADGAMYEAKRARAEMKAADLRPGGSSAPLRRDSGQHYV